MSPPATDIRPIDFSTGSDVVIRVENLWKQYRLGTINHGTLKRDLQTWWARTTGKQDPNQKVDQVSQVSNRSTIQPLNPSTSASDTTKNDPEDRFWALRDVSFDVKQGEVLGIIGKNGAGKSTLLKILSKVTTPTKGKVKIRGRVASMLEVGTGFHPELTGQENIFLNGAILGMNKTEIHRKFDEIVAFAEIEKFIDTPVKRYSSGMYVRLAFAVAAHLEPEILIIDEVLAVGDAQFQKKCLGKMQEVGKEGRTVLFVSHNIGILRNLCDRTILLDKGQVLAKGVTDEVIARYYASMSSGGAVYQSAGTVAKQPVAIVNAELRDLRGNLGEELPCGAGMRISFTVQCRDGVRIDRPWVGVRIHAANGDLISHIANREAGCELPAIEGQKTLTCELPQMNLLPGDYRIGLILANANQHIYEALDCALTFSITPNDVFGTGMILTSRHGQIFMSSQWDVS